MKKIMVLGGNSATIGVVCEAVKQGHFVIVVDKNPLAIAKKYANKSVEIDGDDVESIIEYATINEVDGVILGAAETLMHTYCKVCEELKLPCYGSEYLFNIMTNKQLFKDCCIQNNVNTIEGFVKRYDEEITNDFIQYPVIIKPVDGSASRGISVCTNKDEYIKGLEYARTISKSDICIVEKYMVGQEVVAYYAFQNNNPVFLAMCDRYTEKQENSVQLPTAYIFPSKYTGAYISNTDLKIKTMFRNIGVSNGVMFLQGFANEKGAQFYEPGYRLNGAQEHYIIDNICNIDSKKMLINFALYGNMDDENIEMKSDPFLKGKCGCKLSVLSKTGKIMSIIGLDLLKNNKKIVEIMLNHEIGDIISEYGTLDQIVCRFFIVSDSFKELANTINYIQDEFDVLDHNGKSMILGKFDTKILMDY